MSELLTSILKNWQTDAANESNEKYFLYFDDVKTVLDGSKCFVIGRKGSGKTAICQYIEKINEYDAFSAKLDFKNFPFNLLYQYNDNKYSLQHKYITLWIQLIYMQVLKLFLRNESIDASFQDMLKKAFPFYMDSKLENQVKRIDSLKVDASIKGEFMGASGTADIGVGGSVSPLQSSWVDNEDTLLQLVKSRCDNSRYYIVFDALDEDYTNIETDEYQSYYLPLLTSIFKAVQKIRSSLEGYKIYPVVFLREDIYRQIKDNDKTKWEDTKLQLEWTEEKLKEMLAHRISNEIGSVHLSYDEAVNRIFTSDALIKRKRYSHNRIENIPLFKTIMRNSQARPRDLISFIICCCKTALDNKQSMVRQKDLSGAMSKYSERLAGELRDEIQNVVPEIETVYSLLSDIRKQIFTLQEFEKCKKSYTELDKYQTKDLLSALWEYSIIGNQDRVDPSKHYFKYQNGVRRFSANVSFIIHKGIYNYLQIT